MTAGVTPIRPLAPIVAMLAGDPAIFALCGGAEATSPEEPAVPARVWGVEINPADLGPDATAARKAIVVRGNGQISNASVPYSVVRASLRCYGETFTEAYTVWAAVLDLFKRPAHPRRVGNAYVHDGSPTTGPFEFVDPDLEWPYVLGEWRITINDREITP